MDRATVMHHLSLARRHVEQGQRHIASQEELIARLEARGLDSSSAQNLLTLFEHCQRLHVANCARLEDELKVLDLANPPQWA